METVPRCVGRAARRRGVEGGEGDEEEDEEEEEEEEGTPGGPPRTFAAA